MSLRIDQDHHRFKDIVRGKVRENLKKFISNGEILGKQGDKVVSVPIPHIDIPKLVFGDNGQGGVGQGEGNPGDALSQGDGVQEGQGSGRAGQGEGEHALEVELSLDELADILGEELALPRIENKGKSKIVNQKDRYVGIRKVGPNALRHFKRTYKEALKRSVASGQYHAEKGSKTVPVIVPIKDDMRYRAWKTTEEPVTHAVIIYMMDVSGSMGDEQKEVVRTTSFWIDTWLSKQYKGIETRFVIHDATAKEVDRDTFFKTRESGGTMISTAYQLAHTMIEEHFPVSEWNTYLFHFSDGDNWSNEDTSVCMDLIKNKLLPACNLFGYGQVESPYGSGQFIKDLREQLSDPKLVCSDIRNKEGIMDSIKDFLGKGK